MCVSYSIRNVIFWYHHHYVFYLVQIAELGNMYVDLNKGHNNNELLCMAHRTTGSSFGLVFGWQQSRDEEGVFIFTRLVIVLSCNLGLRNIGALLF